MRLQKAGAARLAKVLSQAESAARRALALELRASAELEVRALAGEVTRRAFTLPATQYAISGGAAVLDRHSTGSLHPSDRITFTPALRPGAK